MIKPILYGPILIPSLQGLFGPNPLTTPLLLVRVLGFIRESIHFASEGEGKERERESSAEEEPWCTSPSTETVRSTVFPPHSQHRSTNLYIYVCVLSYI